MKGTAGVFAVIGWVGLIAGVAGVGWGLLSHSLIGMSLVPMWASFAVMGLIFLLVGRWIGRLLGAGDIPNGVPATARIMSVQDTGVTINNLNMVVNVELLVSVEGAPAYTASSRVVLQGRTMWGALQPGMTVPVKVDPADPSRVAVDLTGVGGGAANASPEVLAQAVNTVLGSGGAAAGAQAGMITMKAADIIRDGLKTEGKLVSVTPTGLTASQATGGLAPDEADDPLVVLVFTFAGDGGKQETCKGVSRVPDGKAAFLAPGATVPVAYLAGRPETATIDWPRLA